MARPKLQPLPALVRLLQKRYPLAYITAYMLTEARSGRLMREIEFSAPRGVLLKYGLLAPNGKIGDFIDEFGTRRYSYRNREGGPVQILHHDWLDEGRTSVSKPRSNPDNLKTRAVVAKMLARITKGVAHG